jgi:hypothetical protein
MREEFREIFPQLDVKHFTREGQGMKWPMAVAAALVLLAACGPARGQSDENDVYVISRPERTRAEIDAAYAQMPAVGYQPPRDRWRNLPRTASILRGKRPALRVLMLGDSIVNDTSRSGWEMIVQDAYPDTAITKTAVVRGSTGCWWYREPERMKRYVIDQKPDLLIIGGISQRHDVDAVLAVALQAKTMTGCDVLLMTGAFGNMDPTDDTRWRPDIPKDEKDYRYRLWRVAQQLRAGFLDMTGLWGKYVRASGRPLGWFKRDSIHANERGEQILGRILAAHLSPDPRR